MAIAATQLDFLSIQHDGNGLNSSQGQEDLHDWIVFVGQDEDLERAYACLERVFRDKYVVLDIETYGCTAPDVALEPIHRRKAAGKKRKQETNILQSMALSPYFGDMRLLQFSGLTQDQVLVIDLKTKWERDRLSPAYRDFIEAVKHKVLEFASTKGVFIGHNIGFDLLFLRHHWQVKTYMAQDTMILSQLLHAGVLTYRHGLKDCCERHLGIAVDKTEQMSDFSLPLRRSQLNYAASDIQNTKSLYIALRKKIIDANLSSAAFTESCFTSALVEINHFGLPVDTAELDRQIKFYENTLLKLEIEFVELYPYFNVKSAQQIGKIVDIINAQIAKKKRESAQDDDGLDEDDDELDLEEETEQALTEFKSGSSKSDLALLEDHRVIQLVCDYRTLMIYLNYARQVKQELITVEDIQRVSGTIRQLTRKGQGRTCSGNKKAPIKCQQVNLQNPPSVIKQTKRLKKLGCPNIRNLFIAPAYFKLLNFKDFKRITDERIPDFTVRFEFEFYKESHTFFMLLWLYSFRTLNIDLPAAHLAISSYLSGEKAMEEAAAKKLDLHAITMYSVFKVVAEYEKYRHFSIQDISNINKEKFNKLPQEYQSNAGSLYKEFKPIRAMCKNVVYSGLNAGSAPTLQQTIKTGQKIEVPIEVCEAMVNAFPDVFPKIAALRTLLFKEGNKHKVMLDGHLYGILQTDYCPNKIPGYSQRIYSYCKTSPDGRKYMGQSEIANIWLSCESQIIKKAIALIYQEAVFEKGYDLRLGLLCHDELVAQVPQQQAIDCARIVRKHFLNSMRDYTGNGKIEFPELEKAAYTLIMNGWEH